MANPRVLGYLGRALSHEFSAVQQYLTHAGLAELWGLAEVAQYFEEEARGEQVHAARLTRRMLELGAMPNASQLTPTRAGPTLTDLLESDRAMEVRAAEIYREAAHYCALIGDTVDRELFTKLMEEELEHTRELESWIARLRQPASTR
ncbi:ferritin-like domain-containing protein [Thiococcus pfennigii]|jgi:bacterioferritin|uniref:ferritin-like domain-containing protein n=2 Tax=Thiococcus pfennigii TaxID=1057 RepID=UPI001A91C2BE|nr:ferritin-like domain-containing protein [Thiococcus pfennigii]